MLENNPVNVPIPAKPMHLSLSGGGFRASFFHLGALYALAHTGRLQNLQMLTSVSGGSIAAAMFLGELVKSGPAPLDRVGLMNAAAQAHFALIRHTRLSPRHKAVGSLRALSRALIYNEFGTSMAMERLYAKWFKEGWSGSAPVDHLPEWRIATSDCMSGSRTQLIFNDRGAARSVTALYVPITREQIAQAVSASAAVPFLFEPVTWNAGKDVILRLSDGGVLDNQGVRELTATDAQLVCIDASARLGTIKAISGWSTMIRATDMLMHQTRADALPPNVELFELRQPSTGPTRANWWQELMDLRTDLDDFNVVEADLLFLAGYQSVAGDNLPPEHEKLANSEGLWRLTMESGSLKQGDPKYKDFAKILEILRRGKYLWTGGFRVPSVVSIISSMAAIYLCLTMAAAVLMYLLLLALASTRIMPQWLLETDVDYLYAALWIGATMALARYHIGGARRLVGHHRGVTFARSIIAPIALVPIIVVMLPIRCSIFVSARDADVFWLVQRINKYYGKHKKFSFSTLLKI
jgi:predicted acylesterase/phospholipase RssA